MQLTRRRAVATAGALVAGLTGCVAADGGDAARAYDRTQNGDRRGPRQGRAEPMILEDAVVVDDPDLELSPGNDTVRFPALMSDDGVVEYGTMSFGRWSRIECAEAGLDPVWDRVHARLGDDAVGLGRGLRSTLPGLVVELSLTTVLDGDGNVRSEPTVSFERVLDVTPPSVRVTVSLDGQEATHTIPVQVVTETVTPLSSPSLVLEPNQTTENQSKSTRS